MLVVHSYSRWMWQSRLYVDSKNRAFPLSSVTQHPTPSADTSIAYVVRCCEIAAWSSSTAYDLRVACLLYWLHPALVLLQESDAMVCCVGETLRYSRARLSSYKLVHLSGLLYVRFADVTARNTGYTTYTRVPTACCCCGHTPIPDLGYVHKSS